MTPPMVTEAWAIGTFKGEALNGRREMHSLYGTEYCVLGLCLVVRSHQTINSLIVESALQHIFVEFKFICITVGSMSN